MMMLILIVSVTVIVTIGCILKKLSSDMSQFELDILSFSIKDFEDISPSYKAIKQALENKQNIDK